MLNSLIINNPNDKNNIKNLLINFDNNNKFNIKDNNNFSYENLQIEVIISEEKIHTKNNNEIVFKDYLFLAKTMGK